MFALEVSAAIFVGYSIGYSIGHLAEAGVCTVKKMLSSRKVKETPKAIYFTDRQQLERVFKKLILIKQTQERHKREEQMLHRSFHLVCNKTELF